LVVLCVGSCRLALLGAAWCLVVIGGAWLCLVVPCDRFCCLVLLGAAWWCIPEQCVWFVPFGAAWHFLVVLGGASWWFVVLRGAPPLAIIVPTPLL
jgi:hypothetical protein